MTRRAIPAVLLVPLLVVALVVSTSACGTVANFRGGVPLIGIPPQPPPPPIAYGGVQWDIERAIKSDQEIYVKALIFPIWLVDFGLSATLDTATLPIVFGISAWRAWDRMTGDQPAKPPVRPASGSPREWGWFSDPFKPTLAESILNPPPPDEEPD
jgi:hypothetical protein